MIERCAASSTERHNQKGRRSGLQLEKRSTLPTAGSDFNTYRARTGKDSQGWSCFVICALEMAPRQSLYFSATWDRRLLLLGETRKLGVQRSRFSDWAAR
eukprot:6202878-Pleurochrysis_carterae.AAC.4